MDNWYYKLFGDEFGPVTLDALVDLAKSETLTPDDEVRFGDNGPWRRAGSMGQLMTHMPSGAHIPSTPVTIATSSAPATSLALPASDEPAGWFYQLFGEQFGPVAFDELVELAKKQTLSVDDEVRFGETGIWRRAGSIGQLMAHLPFQAKKNAFSIEVAPAVTKSRPDDDLELGEQIELREEIPVPASSRTVESPSTNPRPLVSKPAATEESWWCMIEGKEYGPVDLPKLTAWAASGRLHRNDFVRRGVDAYIAATELPGLFPELPPAVVETKAEVTTRATSKSMSTFNPPSPSASSTPAAAQPAENPAPEYTPPKPVTNWQANAGAGGLNRPAASVRRPPAKSSSGSFDVKKLAPLLGVVGVLLLGGLIYLALPYLPLGDSTEVKAFKGLQAAYMEVLNIRNQEVPGKKEDFAKAGQKMSAAAKKVEGTITGKGPATTKLKSLAKKLQELGKDDLTKMGDSEKAIGKSFESLARLLKVK